MLNWPWQPPRVNWSSHKPDINTQRNKACFYSLIRRLKPQEKNDVGLAISSLSCVNLPQPMRQHGSPDLRPKVRTTIVSEQEFSRTLQIPTTIQAIRSAVLAPKVPGRISDINVRIGDSVKQGDLLLSLEKSDYLAGFQEAKASKELAQLQAEQAALHLSRFEPTQEGAITSVQ